MEILKRESVKDFNFLNFFLLPAERKSTRWSRLLVVVVVVLLLVAIRKPGGAA